MTCSLFTNDRPDNMRKPSLKRSRANDCGSANKRFCAVESCSDNENHGLRRSMSLSATTPCLLSLPPGAIEPYSHQSPDKHMTTHIRNKSFSVAALRRRSHLDVTCRKRRQLCVPRSDLHARAKCFDYLVSAIDEVWAQYCTYTSTAEDEIYNCDEDVQRKRSSSLYSDIPTSPASLYHDDDNNNDDDDDNTNYSSDAESSGPRTPHHSTNSLYSPKYSLYNSKQMYNRKPNIVDSHIDYSDNNDQHTFVDNLSTSQSSSTVSDKSLAPSEQPGSVFLLNLKTRLMNAKYYFQELLDNVDIESSCSFWNRWDMIKYSAIELVEDDGDDDDVLEATIEKLENGRYYAMNY